MKSLTWVFFGMMVAFGLLALWAGHRSDMYQARNNQLRQTITYQTAVIDSLERGIKIDGLKSMQIWDKILKEE